MAKSIQGLFHEGTDDSSLDQSVRSRSSDVHVNIVVDILITIQTKVLYRLIQYIFVFDHSHGDLLPPIVTHHSPVQRPSARAWQSARRSIVGSYSAKKCLGISTLKSLIVALNWANRAIAHH